MEFFLLILGILFVYALFRINAFLEKKEVTEDTADKEQNTDSYQLYTNWCKRQQESPITKDAFENLGNEGGGINLSDVMNLHRTINPEQKKEPTEIKREPVINDYEERLQKEAEERKKRDEAFVKSAIAGYVTNSTAKGTLLGGSLLGGMFGDYLNKKPKK
jgi:hypothetical protein